MILDGTEGIVKPDNLTVDEVIAAIRKGPLHVAAETLAGTARGRMTDPVDGAPSKPDDLTFLLYRRLAD